VVESGFAMTEVLNASQLALLRRIAAAGYVRIVTAGEKTTLDELVARKLILGNQLTEAGWRELLAARMRSERTSRSSVSWQKQSL
jgi:hypothetical protein